MIEFNQHQKFDKTPIITYENLKYLIKRLMYAKKIPKFYSQQK